MALQDSAVAPSDPFVLLSLTIFGVLVVYFALMPVVEYFYDVKQLRQYPNQNFLSGLTNLGQVYERHASFRTANLYEAHKKHPIIRTGPTALSFRDVGAIKDKYGQSSHCVKDDMYAALKGSHTHLFNVKYKVADKVECLLRQFDISDDSAKRSGSAKWSGKSWAIIEFQRWSNLFTIDSIADIVLSCRLGLLDSGNDMVTVRLGSGKAAGYPFIESLHAQNRPASILVWPTRWLPTLQTIMGLTSSWYRNQYRVGAQFGEIVRHLTKDRISRYRESGKLDDLFHSLMEDCHGSPVELEIGEMESELSLLSDAGSETTSIALTNVMHHLLRNPEKLAKLREEIEAFLDPDETIASFTKVRNLPYMKARSCIMLA